MTYASKRADRLKQTEAKARMRGQRAFALLMGVRVGKSKCVADDWGEMVSAGQVDDLLVVAPGGAYRPWPRAIAADVPDEITARAKFLLWDSGAARSKVAGRVRDAFVEHSGPRVLVVNVEALSTVKAARALCVEFLRQRPGRSVMAVDESVTIKGEDSECADFCVNVLGPLATYRRILTGLVTPRSPVDLFMQFKFLDWRILGHATIATFKARYTVTRQVCMVPSAQLYGMLKSRLGLIGRGYLTSSELRLRTKVLAPDLDVNAMSDADMRGFIEMAADGGVSRDAAVLAIKALGGYVQTIPIVDGYQNLEELNAKIAPYSFRCTLRDCYDLPASDYSFRDVPWHPEQRRVYEELRANATAELESMDHVTATHVITRMLRLHQVLCGHAVSEETGEVVAVPEYRTRALVERLQDYDGKAVIWCSYDYNVRGVTEALKREFGDRSVARFWGGNARTREVEEEIFKTTDGCRFMVATPDAGKYGRDWSVADLCEYFSCRNNLDHREQSEGRVHADGKTTMCAYEDYRVPGTVEDGIVRCLREKIDMAAAISGDEWRRWLI